MKIIIYGFLILLIFTQCVKKKETVSIELGNDSEILNFAKDELSKYLSANYQLDNSSSKWHIVLQINDNLENSAFHIERKNTSSEQIIELTGADESAVLCAMYTLLEDAGMRFEISGPIFQQKLNLDVIQTSKKVLPKIQKRGIRQHINFPMDISSFSLEEAKEYIRNLARLRFNYITFHTYPGQWYEDPINGGNDYAGNFFYNRRYDIPNDKFYQQIIRNKSTYCIPEIEPYFENRAKRSEESIAWLREVIKESKRVGLTVRLSFEPRGVTSDIQNTKNTISKLIAYYPMIDELELITTETGHKGNSFGLKEVADHLVPLFGKEIMNDAIAMKPIWSGNANVAEIYAQIGHQIKVLDAVLPELLEPKGIKGSLSFYMVIPEYLEGTYHILRKYAPDYCYAFMPGHGSNRVARFLPHANMEKKDWQKTLIYSWLEFDGLMFLQQNGVRGIRSLIELGEDINGLEQMYAMAFNHWRIAENKITARYASESALFGAQDETSFYTDYAKSYGIENTDDFVKAMKQLDVATWYATNDLPNVGFCYPLRAYSQGFGFIGLLKEENLIQGEELYQKALDFLNKCNPSENNEEGKDLLALLDNRLRATIVYLKAYEKGAKIRQYDINNLNDTQRKEIASIINESIAGFKEYIKIYFEIMPDRTSEGTIINAYHVRIGLLKRIFENVCHITYDQDESIVKTNDVVPAPDL